MQETFDPALYPELLVGLQSPDDAAVWKLDDQRGLVLTTDFFTPVVDDPRDYGRIAAANSLSDIYAMGGTPFLALNIAALPPDLGLEISSRILQGGAEVAREAGVVIAGGHSIQDKEPKYGLVVAGFVNLDRMFTKAGARPGDKLYLTKPIGFGTITTALKRQVAAVADVQEAVRWMVTLNGAASQVAAANGVRGATDISGYSLLGHASEMAEASNVQLRLKFDRIPLLPNALPYAMQFIFPGGTYDNQAYYKERVAFECEIADYQRLMLFDPQTSGGLLLAVPPDNCTAFEQLMQTGGNAFWRIGEAVDGRGILLV